MAKRTVDSGVEPATTAHDPPAESDASEPSPPTAAPAGKPALFPVVGVGASAGGLEALREFLGGVPAASGLAFVIVQHLDPNHQGCLPELLQRATTMPVMQATHRIRMQADSVYVIPPNRDLSILRDRLHLLEPVAPRGLRLPIDFFFRALAEDRREQAIGVVLSGMGSDGTLGLAAIKEQGGLTLVQEPADAKFDSMPRSAIDAGFADLVAHTGELPLRICEITQPRTQPRVQHCVQPEPLTDTSSPAALPGDDAESGNALETVCLILRAHTGHDFSLYKEHTLYRRIERRMAIHRLDRIAAYVQHLRENSQEIDLLFKELLIGVTTFFRDPESWNALATTVLPELLATSLPDAQLRAWVTACSTGEEAYSLAITFREALERTQPRSRQTLQIFATDLDADAIRRARQGFYPANIAADISPEHLARYFVAEGSGYRVTPAIRAMVVFATQNVLTDPPFIRLDLLTCRNLLIYLNAGLQKKLLPLFYYSLKQGGVLMLGSSESVGKFTDLFTTLDSKARLFQRADGALRALEIEFPTRSLANRSHRAMDNQLAPSASNLQALADQLLLRQFTPSAVLVNSAGDVLYINGRTGKYLEPAAGKANWNIHAMAREGLRQEIALALPHALRSGEKVTRRKLHVSDDSSDAHGGIDVDLTVLPISDPAALRDMAMLIFVEAAAAPAPPANATPGDARTAELEQALAQAQQEIRDLRLEMQNSQEQLKSANEELQSTNEELQSTNEELTTSKEEMQSLNEELHSVNLEMESKLAQLSAASNDLKNLFNSTDTATLLLDCNLRVRRFTTQATQLFKLIPGDHGRLLSDLASELAYPDLADDARSVLLKLALSDREISTRDGRWFQVKIMPYRTLENVTDGVVITANDISRAKQLEAELRALANGPQR